MKVTDLLHKRVLVAEKQSGYSNEKIVKEIKILEISPSQNWVKVMDDCARKYWKHYSDIVPVEVLESVNKDKP